MTHRRVQNRNRWLGFGVRGGGQGRGEGFRGEEALDARAAAIEPAGCDAENDDPNEAAQQISGVGHRPVCLGSDCRLSGQSIMSEGEQITRYSDEADESPIEKEDGDGAADNADELEVIGRCVERGGVGHGGLRWSLAMEWMRGEVYMGGELPS